MCRSGRGKKSRYASVGTINDDDDNQQNGDIDISVIDNDTDDLDMEDPLNITKNQTDDTIVDTDADADGAVDTKTEAYADSMAPQSCSICYEEYKPGEEIAWSNNKHCRHDYHMNCIVEWLMKHDDCPTCRAEYILDKESPSDPTCIVIGSGTGTGNGNGNGNGTSDADDSNQIGLGHDEDSDIDVEQGQIHVPEII